VKKGLVIIRINGQVRMKIATGVNGAATAKVADTIRKYGHVPTVVMASILANRGGFKSDANLVAATMEDAYYGSRFNYNVVVACRKTFDDLNFNPIWDDGRNDAVAIVDF
jgi:hypothetical protein